MLRNRPEESSPSILMHQSQSQGDLPRKNDIPAKQQRYLSTVMLKRLLTGRKRKTSADNGVVTGTRRMSPGGRKGETLVGNFGFGVMSVKGKSANEGSPMAQTRRIARPSSKPRAFTHTSKPSIDSYDGVSFPVDRLKSLLQRLSAQFPIPSAPRPKPAPLTLLRKHRDFICRVQAETISPALMKRIIFAAWKRAYTPLHPSVYNR